MYSIMNNKFSEAAQPKDPRTGVSESLSQILHQIIIIRNFIKK